MPPGHGFDCVGDHDTLLRCHEHLLLSEHWPSQERPDIKLHVSIDMYDSESAATNAGPIVATPAPLLFVEVSSGITGPQARQLAAKLLEAADPWDRVTS